MHAEVSGGLGCPGPCWVRGDPEKVDASGGVFDDEQNMKPSEQRGVDAGEVCSTDTFSLRANELCPGGSGPITGRVDTGGAQDLPNGGRGDGVPESLEFAVDASVSPTGVLAGLPNGQPPELWVDGWPSSRFVRWLCPMSDDPPSMPAEHGFGFDDQKRLTSTCSSHD